MRRRDQDELAIVSKWRLLETFQEFAYILPLAILIKLSEFFASLLIRK